MITLQRSLLRYLSAFLLFVVSFNSIVLPYKSAQAVSNILIRQNGITSDSRLPQDRLGFDPFSYWEKTDFVWQGGSVCISAVPTYCTGFQIDDGIKVWANGVLIADQLSRMQVVPFVQIPPDKLKLGQANRIEVQLYDVQGPNRGAAQSLYFVYDIQGDPTCFPLGINEKLTIARVPIHSMKSLTLNFELEAEANWQYCSWASMKFSPTEKVIFSFQAKQHKLEMSQSGGYTYEHAIFTASPIEFYDGTQVDPLLRTLEYYIGAKVSIQSVVGQIRTIGYEGATSLSNKVVFGTGISDVIHLNPESRIFLDMRSFYSLLSHIK